jgi:DinB superfamily
MLPDRVSKHHNTIMQELKHRLETLVSKTKQDFDNISDAEASSPAIAGGWSRKQILGHLIDSASNNHQRFVRALLQDEVRMPGYDQEGCVRVERYQELQWGQLLALWQSYNRFLAHILAGVPEAKRRTPCFIGEHPVMTLEELAADYLRHMRHHLEQIRPGATEPRP